MKKSDALKHIEDPDALKIASKLERLQLYYLSRVTPRFGAIPQKIPVLLTHFYEHGLKFKVLTTDQLMSWNGFYHIRYYRLPNFTLTPMPPEDLPLFAGVAHPHMAEAFKRAKPFKKGLTNA